MSTSNCTPSPKLAILSQIIHFIANWILKMLPVLIVVAIWECIARGGLVNTDVLPRFSRVVVAGWDWLKSGQVWFNLWASFYRALVGLVAGSAVGIAVGILMARSRLARDIIDPFVTLTFPLPKTAFIPIALLWFGVGDASTIFLVFLSTLVPMIISSYHGARAIPEQFIWSARAMGASHLRVLTSIIIPATLTYVVNGLRIALAFSIVIALSSEMVAAYDGMGKFISIFSENGNYDYMFAAILIVVGVAFLIDRGVLWLSSHLLCWTESDD